MANRRYIDFPIASSVGDSDIILIWQSGANKQTTKATFLSGLPENLDELNDVAISGLTNGQILRYDSVTGKWENTDQGNLDLNDLNDVSIVSPSNGQVLVYNSSTSKWENSSAGFVPYTGAVTTVNLGAQTIQAGSFVKAGGTAAQFLKANGSVDSNVYGTGTVTSVALTMPTAFSVANSPITTAGTLAVTGAGTVGQYIRGDGSLADFPESSGGGSSVSYYLNGSIAQGTIGGVAYKELNKVPVLGAGTDFTINANGYIASFITDAGDPNLLEIAGGNWNFETYFSASSGGGSPSFYVELYKVNSGGTATLIASNSTFPELIAFGTNIISYFSTLAVPTTTLTLTDRLAIRYYVTHSGRTITLHTEDNHLCQIITTFTTGLTALNGLTAQVQNFAVGTSGTDFAIASATATHTFNLPTASATNRGALSSADWSMFNAKENAITAGTTAQYFRGDKTFQTLNTAIVPELTNLYYTEARVNANTNVAANTAARHNAVTLGTPNGLSLSTQVLSLGLASAGVTGALSGTDWTTFNNKQNALTNPVTGTGTINYLARFTALSTIGTSSVYDTGSVVGIGNTGNASYKLLVTGNNASIDSSGNNTIYLSAGTTESFLATSFIAGGPYVPLSFEVGGSKRMTLFTDGNLLLQSGGTFTNNGARLQVSGEGRFKVSTDRNLAIKFDTNITISAQSDTGAPESIRHYADTFRIYTATTAAGLTERLTISNSGAATFSGDVGVVKSSPLKYLQNSTSITTGSRGDLAWYNSSVSTVALIRASAITDNVGTSLEFYTRPASGSLTQVFTLASTGAATFSSNVTVQNGNTLILLQPSNGNGSVIRSVLNGDFRVTTGGTTDALTITNGGNVGIGTATPGTKLTVVGETGVLNGNYRYNAAILQNQTTARGVGFGFKSDEQLGLIYGETAAAPSNLAFMTYSGSAFLERMRITSSGNVGIGIDIPARKLDVNGFFRVSDGTVNTEIVNGGGVGFIGTQTNHALALQTNNTEKMRITSGGYSKFSNNSSYNYLANTFFEVNQSIADWTQVNVNKVASGTPLGIFIGYTALSPNNTGAPFLACNDSIGERMTVRSNGGIANYQANNVNLSDIRTKKEIEPLESYWNKFKDIEIVKFKYKDQTHDDFNIGVIAQQVEKIAPEFIDIDGWGKTPKNEEPLKSVYSSDLQHAAIKVLQEAMLKIESMQKEIDTLKN